MATKKTASKPPSGKSPKEKFVYKFGEVARMTGVEVKTLEGWEEEFPFLNAGQTGSGQKFFRRKDVDIILRVKELLAEKTLTLAGIKRRIVEEFDLGPAEPVHPDKLRKTLHNVRDELNRIASSLKNGPEKK